MSFYNDASLVLIPSGTKEGVVFSQKPTNGDGDFTFTRASSATRVNSDGLIEKETQNLLLQSNSFDTTWTNSDTTETSGQSGYDGSSDAWKIDKSAASGYITQSISQNGVQTFSVYAKAGTLDWIRLVAVAGTDQDQYFDLSTGTLGATGTNIDAVIDSVGGGWYRCSIALSQSVTSVRIYPADDDNDVSGATGNIYIQDAQLNQGLVADSYIETTTTAVYGGITDNIPRLDYTDASCPSLLLEPQRTNLATNSEYMLDFAKGSASSLQANAATSPDGKNNATYFYCNTTTTNAYIVQGWIGTSGVQYAVSFYAKAKELNFVYIKNVNDSGSQSYFDLSNGTFTLFSGIDSMSIEDVGDGWYRCIAVSTSTSTGIKWIPILKGDANEGVYVYGLQIEQSSYPTSYIPTYGTSVTFERDTAINQANSNLPTGYPFSLFAEVDVVDTFSGQAITLLDSSNGTSYYTIDYDSNVWRITARPNTVIARISSTSAPTLGTHKLLGIYTDSTMKLYLDGALIASGNNTETWNTNIDDLLLGQLRTVSDIGTRNPVREALIFNQELTNEEAIALTQV